MSLSARAQQAAVSHHDAQRAAVETKLNEVGRGLLANFEHTGMVAEYLGYVESEEPYSKSSRSGFGGSTIEYRRTITYRIQLDDVVLVAVAYENAGPSGFWVEKPCASCQKPCRSGRGGSQYSPSGYDIYAPTRNERTTDEGYAKQMTAFVTAIGEALRTERQCMHCVYNLPQDCPMCRRPNWR